MKKLLGTGAAVLATVGLLHVPGARAAEPSATVTSATVTGDEVTVGGTATFGDFSAPQSVGGTKSAGDVGAAAGEAAGINLTDALVAPLANGTGLRFTWVVSSMPAQVPPEGVRYTWAFVAGNRAFQLQAKRTNVASVTTVEDPVGHIQHVRAQREFFQLRGACVDSYLGTPVAGCYHLAFLNGTFNPASKTVTMDVPFETRDSIGRLVAPELKPGVELLASTSAGMSIAGSFQAGVSNTTVSTYLNGWNPYYTAPVVHLGIGPADADPLEIEYTTPATLSGASFTGKVKGFDANDNNTVFVRACAGVQCGYGSSTVA